MNFTTPDVLKTIDRTPAGLGTLPPRGFASAAPRTSSGDLRSGETFGQSLNRQRALKNQETTAPGAAAQRAGESVRDFLNRRHSIQASPPPAVSTPGPATTGPAPAAASKSGESAAGLLNRQKSGDAAGAGETRRQQSEKAAGDLVSNALILPMLKQLRRSPWGENGIFSGGIGEKTFGPEFDMQIADRIASSPRLGVKTALANRLMQRNQPAAIKGPETNTLDAHG